MKKLIIIISASFILALTGGIIYLNRVVLPRKVKSLIVKGIAETLHKRVELGSLRIHIFKGLVLRDVTVYDENGKLLTIKEASCSFLPLPFFKKRVIIPSLRIDSPVLFLERRQDASFNISDLFTGNGKPSAQAADGTGFKVIVSRVSINGGRIDFIDNGVNPSFSGRADNLNLVVYLSLPAKVKFSLKSDLIPQGRDALPAKIVMAGEYDFPARAMSARVNIDGFAVAAFGSYYGNLGLSLPQGSIDAKIAAGVKDGILSLSLEAGAKQVYFSKAGISGRVDSGITAGLRYVFEGSKLDYSGSMNVVDAEVSGIPGIGTAGGISGNIGFSSRGMSSDNLKANIFGLPVAIKANLENFSSPAISLDCSASAGLDAVIVLLKKKFGPGLPVDIATGMAGISLSLDYQAAAGGLTRFSGTVNIIDAGLRFKSPGAVITAINGPVTFCLNRLSWENVRLKYLGTDYTSSGELVDFRSPQVRLKLSSGLLALESTFSSAGKKMSVSSLTGSYLDSKFTLSGEADFSQPQAVMVSASGRLTVDLKDIKEPLKKYKDRLDKANPQGILWVDCNFDGNVKDLKNCSIEADASSDSVSFYGLKSGSLNLHYRQDSGIADISALRMALYDGSIEASAKMNFGSDNMPYWISLDADGVKLEKLKDDTPARKSDLAGSLKAHVKLNGFSGDLSRLTGAGTLEVTGGKLWELDFFKGLGALLFTSDFSSVIFSEGSCGFTIGQKHIYTDSLKLTSSLSVIRGEAKVGFDGSLDGSLDAEVLPDVPLTGTVKDVTTAILGQASRVGVIKISGSLKEPKFKFVPAVVDIIRSFKNAILGNN